MNGYLDVRLQTIWVGEMRAPQVHENPWKSFLDICSLYSLL